MRNFDKAEPDSNMFIFVFQKKIAGRVTEVSKILMVWLSVAALKKKKPKSIGSIRGFMG